MKPVISFSKVDLPYGWMGNMAPFPIVYENKKWLTTEALFQAMRFKDEKIKEEIRAEKSPMSAKMKAKKHKAQYAVIPMSEQDIENMRLCVKLKVEQHPELKKKLLLTGNYDIYEDIGKRNGERHFFWGAKRENDKWIGNNMMGKIWMELRETIKSEI